MRARVGPLPRGPPLSRPRVPRTIAAPLAASPAGSASRARTSAAAAAPANASAGADAPPWDAAAAPANADAGAAPSDSAASPPLAEDAKEQAEWEADRERYERFRKAFQAAQTMSQVRRRCCCWVFSATNAAPATSAVCAAVVMKRITYKKWEARLRCSKL